MGYSRFREGRPSPLIFAHRGDSSRAPENTLEAARLGFASGAAAWELDVRLTRDGVPIVLHDETLARTTDVADRFGDDPRASEGFRASDFDWEEIRGLDAGSWFVASRGGHRSALALGTLHHLPARDRDRYAEGGVRVPSLAEALAMTRDLDWLVNVELKSFPDHDPKLVDATLAVIDDAGVSDRVLLSSFDHEDVARIARDRPEIATGVLIGNPLHRASYYVREVVGADFLHASAEAMGVDSLPYRLDPKAAHLRKRPDPPVPVFVYTVNDTRPEGLATHLVRNGVEGLFTDKPEEVLRLLADLHEVQPAAPAI